ncbi:ankyrin repeat family protein [Citrus sinensis]|uniref:Ankyrin repeat family protein n=1 Tax=Citrus sinensis TaxID=2711 RepID=A0ACB8IQA3_CITSI|nr:ankyrin repeat family protein [Citrus sinensis]
MENPDRISYADIAWCINSKPSSDVVVALLNIVRERVQQFLNAACTGNLDLLKKIAKQLDDQGKGLSKTVADIKDANKRGALHFAAREGKTDVCKYLLEELKLDVDTQDEDGETPLLHAARQGHTEAAKYLFEHGANPAIPSNLGATALHHSAGIGNIELLTYLLSKGAEVDSESDAGTPLIWAAGHGQQEAVKVLLEHHANPNAETEDNITPLLSAVAAGSLTCLDLLIQAGANANIVAGGATPLHIAADIGSTEIIKCLLKAGADPNVTDEDGQKPIQVAAARGNREAVEILFPLTSEDPSIPKWTVDGILEYMQSESGKQLVIHSFLNLILGEWWKEETRNLKENNAPKDKAPMKELPEVRPEIKKKAAEAKARGDEAFKQKDYLMAVDAYTQAIDFDPSDATLLSNRSLCWIRLGQAEHALADAKACRALRPDWPKACYREANAFYEGVTLDPENKELVNAFREAVEAGRKFHGTDKK